MLDDGLPDGGLSIACTKQILVQTAALATGESERDARDQRAERMDCRKRERGNEATEQEHSDVG
jgi:hypothetical protein